MFYSTENIWKAPRKEYWRQKDVNENSYMSIFVVSLYLRNLLVKRRIYNQTNFVVEGAKERAKISFFGSGTFVFQYNVKYIIGIGFNNRNT